MEAFSQLQPQLYLERPRTVRSKKFIFIERIGYTINGLQRNQKVVFHLYHNTEETIINMNKLVPWVFLLFTGILIIVVAVLTVFLVCSEVVVKVGRDINGV